jgi:hypothetical protein
MVSVHSWRITGSNIQVMKRMMAEPPFDQIAEANALESGL